MRRIVASRRVRMTICALVLGIALSACTTMQNPFSKSSTPPPAELPPDNAAPAASNPPAGPPPEEGLALAPSQRFADVPLPVGVKEDPEKTFVYEDKSLQIGRLVYTTRSSVNELTNFYIREAPTGSWKLINNIQAAGQELQFVKPGKRLTVIVRELGAPKGRQLVLTVTPDTAQ